MVENEFDKLSLDEIRKAIIDLEEELADLDMELKVTFAMDQRHIAPAEANAELDAIRRDKQKLLDRKQKLLAALSRKLGEHQHDDSD